MDGAVKYAVPVVNNKVTSVVGLQDGEQIHVIDIRRHHNTPTLADRSHRLDPDLFAYFRTDNSLSPVLILGSVGVGYVGVESESEELLDHRNGTVAGIGSVPLVCPSLCVALAGLVQAREGPLVLLVDNFRPFYNHTHRPKMNLVIVRHHVIQGIILLVLDPFSLAGGF